jgi:L-rhamnose isomerase
MSISEKLVEQGYRYAQEAYALRGVDVERAMEQCAQIAISMHCWQGDDVRGHEGEGGGASGGIATTGNYPGRARTASELRMDIAQALNLIPGKKKLSLHASYAELNGKKIDRDRYTIEQFSAWLQFAKEHALGLDFNPTYFSHPLAENGFTLASADKGVRDFWIEHGKRCREIAQAFGKALGQTSVVNYWMPDGYKDTPADTAAPRERMIRALDEVFSDKSISDAYELDSVESKLFGLGLESYTVGSHELMLGYAITRGKLYTLDAGHFHPLEYISGKISAVLQYMPQLLLHVSRGVRWDSDHVITLDDELQNIMNEIVHNGYAERVHIGLDYFDASINRVAAWVIGVRNAQKALLRALLTQRDTIVGAEAAGDYTTRLALKEEEKTLPFSAVFDMYCLKQGVPVSEDWLDCVRQYEKEELSKR